jgi:hypothetical protein
MSKNAWRRNNGINGIQAALDAANSAPMRPDRTETCRPSGY